VSTDWVNEIAFNEAGLVCVVAQDATTDEVLMVAWANAEALTKTKETGFAHYFSRKRNELWKKGETSGNTQRVREIFWDCDKDTVLYRVVSDGPACHTGEATCFKARGRVWAAS
jgi:phosphoribosyl-AMP cyclohydrolase